MPKPLRADTFRHAAVRNSLPPRSRRQPPASIAAGLIGGVIALVARRPAICRGVLPSLGAARGAPPGRAQSDVVGDRDAEDRARRQACRPAGGRSVAGQLPRRIAALETDRHGSEANGLSADADARVNALSQKSDRLTGSRSAAIDALQDASPRPHARRSKSRSASKTLEKKLNEPRDDVDVAGAIASAALKAAIDRGGPFLAELDTFDGVEPEDPAVDELRAVRRDRRALARRAGARVSRCRRPPSCRAVAIDDPEPEHRPTG